MSRRLLRHHVRLWGYWVMASYLRIGVGNKLYPGFEKQQSGMAHRDGPLQVPLGAVWQLARRHQRLCIADIGVLWVSRIKPPTSPVGRPPLVAAAVLAPEPIPVLQGVVFHLERVLRYAGSSLASILRRRLLHLPVCTCGGRGSLATRARVLAHTAPLRAP